MPSWRGSPRSSSSSAYGVVSKARTAALPSVTLIHRVPFLAQAFLQATADHRVVFLQVNIRIADPSPHLSQRFADVPRIVPKS